MARERRQKLESIEEELEDVKKRLARIWNAIETTDIEMADASGRIRERRERKEKLEAAADEARAVLAERRQYLDRADAIAAYAEEMSEFLKDSELTETKPSSTPSSRRFRSSRERPPSSTRACRSVCAHFRKSVSFRCDCPVGSPPA